ncbi:hypothetical protein [Ureibacillus sinduriensis]|uniref:Uncharacterized protein n=1 Tax=Ureibacillus sinduriensis BLB-1 = JCM 15800 TaxID=1384057 RepID=A0A0A3IJN1_9BACL|nr:hypothetical protein [Ureibacillus sinduriensis]KGR75082.1 hypothetical protein CD33_12450 [Ureibacillus sinduriensis BLB-1 = JCM 15800]
MARKLTLSEEEVEEIIGLYKTEKNQMGRIEYLEVFRFNKELYEEGRVKSSMSDDFWRKKGRLGKIKIDEANEIFRHKLDTSEDSKILMPSVSDVIYKNNGDIETLLNELIPIEKELFNSIQREHKFKKVNKKLEEQMVKLKQTNRTLNKRVEILEDTLFKIFRFSSYENVPIINFLEIGEEESELVKEALNGMFERPTEFIDWYSEKSIQNEETRNSKIIEINEVNKVSNKIKNRYRT